MEIIDNARVLDFDHNVWNIKFDSNAIETIFYSKLGEEFGQLLDGCYYFWEYGCSGYDENDYPIDPYNKVSLSFDLMKLKYYINK